METVTRTRFLHYSIYKYRLSLYYCIIAYIVLNPPVVILVTSSVYKYYTSIIIILTIIDILHQFE